MLDTPEGSGFNGAVGFNGNIQVAQNHGFRCFRYDIRGNLCSLVYDFEWSPGVNRAVCATSPYWDRPAKPCPFPSKACSHGFYAYYGEDYYSYMSGDDDEDLIVNGVINGYGRCVIGDKGYRSEYANVVALIKPTSVPYRFAKLWETDHPGAIERVVAGLEAKFPTVPIFDSADELLKVIPLPGRPPRNDA